MRPRHRRPLAAGALLALLGNCGARPVGRALERGPAGSNAAAPAAVAAGAAVALLGVEPAATAAPAVDLDALVRWLGEARVVGLGEGEHGTHTLHRLTHRIFAHLVDHAGFDVLALEIDGAHAALLDAWVQGERDDLGAILAERWWGSEIFYDEATIELLRWMRERNRRGDARLRVAGFDLKQPALAARAVVDALRPVDEKAASALEASFRRALAPGAFGLFPNVWGFSGTLRVPLAGRAGPVTVAVELEARAEGLSYGTAGVLVAAGDEQEGKWFAPGELGADWRPVRVELEVAPEAGEVEVVLQHRGNGTVWLTAPRVRVGEGAAAALDLRGIARRPLLMPLLQADDYRHEVSSIEPATAPVLRIEAARVLDESRAAAAAAEAEVRAAVARAGDRLAPGRGAWLLQAARLVRQAVEWRTLAQNDRDVFLADNLRWIAVDAFPRSRILALAHRSHTERRAGRMGAYLTGPLGASYRTVTMLAGTGEQRYFGDLATLSPGDPLVALPVERPAAGTFEAAVGGLGDGDFLLPLAEVAGSAAGRAWLEAVHPRPAEAPEVVIRVTRVEPIRVAGARP